MDEEKVDLPQPASNEQVLEWLEKSGIVENLEYDKDEQGKLAYHRNNLI